MARASVVLLVCLAILHFRPVYGSSDSARSFGFTSVFSYPSVQNVSDPDGENFEDDESHLSRLETADESPVDVLMPIRRTWKSQPVVNGEDVLAKYPTFLSELSLAGDNGANFVLVLVANSEQCHQTLQTITSIAKAYWDDLERKRSVSSSRLYFIMLNASRPNGAKIFRQLRITKVPTVIHLPAKESLPVDEVPSDWIKEPYMQSIDEITSWIDSRSDLKAPLPRALGVTNVADKAATFIDDYGMLIIVLQLSVIFAINAYRFTPKSAMMLITFGAYTISVSGLIFCFLRGAPPLGMTSQGIMFLYPDRGGQFLFEGLLIGFCNIMVSALLVAAGYLSEGVDVLAVLEEYVEGPPPQNYVNRESRLKMLERLTKTGSLCIGMSFVFLLNIWVIFKRKSPWYTPFFW